MITAGMEAGAARLGHGENPKSSVLCVYRARDVASEDFFFFLILGNFHSTGERQIVLP